MSELQTAFKPKPISVSFQRLCSAVLTDDFKQRRRMTLVLMTAFINVVCAAILIYGSKNNIFSAEGATGVAIGCVTTAIVFLVVIRSGLNLRFAEPSLALPQAICAQTLVATAYAVTGPVHPATLILLATVMVFGMFEMRAASVWALLFYSVFLIGSVMAWRAHNNPIDYPPKLQLIHFVLTTTVLSAISSLSIQLRSMRERLRSQKAELEKALDQIRRVATHDELTGLPNRRHMLTLLIEHAVRQNRGGPKFMVALVDMDHFKNVNDTYGHRIGDEALVSFSRQAQIHLRSTDIIGRWGGEEFLLILPQSCPGAPNIGIERLRGALASTQITAQAPNLRMKFSAGITSYMAGEDIEDAIERADKALYAAKEAGRNQTVTLEHCTLINA